MLPVAGRPIVERVMHPLAAHDVREFIVVIHPDDEDIVRHFRGQAEIPGRVRFVHQPKRRGMADALLQARPFIQGSFLLSACDNLVSSDDIGRLLAAWEADPQPSAVLALLPVEPDRLGSVGIVEREGHWVTRIVEKPAPEEAPSDVSSLPLYVFSPLLLDYLDQVSLSPRGEYELQDAIQMLIERHGCVRGVTLQGRMTLTHPQDLLALNRQYLAQDSSLLRVEASSGSAARFVPPAIVEEGVCVGAGCIIGPSVYAEAGCRIGAGAVVQDAVLLRDAIVPSGATVRGKVLPAEAV
jgi:NDP-sugar pyrophosphorylase family protein